MISFLIILDLFLMRDMIMKENVIDSLKKISTMYLLLNINMLIFMEEIIY